MITQNPFTEADKDRYYLWEILMKKDIEAFIKEDWSMIADDFISEGFTGIDACLSDNPDKWKFSFPDVALYRNEWLKQARSFKATEWTEDPGAGLFRVTNISDIAVNGNTALVRKKFRGDITKLKGQKVSLNWQSLFYCRKIAGAWKIAGFTGYLPHHSDKTELADYSKKQLPPKAKQHKTAGPYSPVLIVEQGKLVVISGQAAIDNNGNIIGNTIEEQAAYTLDNCRKALQSAACTLEDTFKVNVYMKDLADWERFNNVYKKYFTAPLPVRTAVQVGLLTNLLIEIELWAIKN